MKLYSTKNKAFVVNLERAIMQGLPPDNGLYMSKIKPLPLTFWEKFEENSFQENSFQIAKHLFEGSISDEKLAEITYDAINFPAPNYLLNDEIATLELFHGPSLAFKDFGARFMSRIMQYYNGDNNQELIILVATSGDTGGAVAFGFHHVPGFSVVILYPKGKVSELQEKQLTTLGGNVHALEIDGTFDDCQALVKEAFLDKDLNTQLRLSSANSINIARLIPQSFYYFESYRQISKNIRKTKDITYVVPSGNFGNITAGLMAKKLGLPIYHFIAATNVNKVVPDYLSTGEYEAKPAVRTLSNAMDVGNPSNFPRILDLFESNSKECSTWNNVKNEITGIAVDDTQTENALKEVYQNYNYIIDPHAAVGYYALKKYMESHANTYGIILETAHSSKFKPDVERILRRTINVPERLAILANKEKVSIEMEVNYEHFKNQLLSKFLIKK
jgi:threonine synthase